MSYCDTPTMAELDQRHDREERRNALDALRDELAAWVLGRWDAEVRKRPSIDVHRGMLDKTWRKVYKRITGNELPRGDAKPRREGIRFGRGT